MMKKTVFALSLILLFSACVDVPTGDEIVQKSIVATSKAQTYSFNISSRMSAFNASDPSGQARSVDMDWIGVVSEKDRKVHMTASVSMDGMSMDMEQYIINDTQYMYIPSFGWLKNETSEDLWDDEYLMLQGDLNTSTGAELLGVERINGVECYAVRLNLSRDEVFDVLAGQMSSELSESELDSIQSIELREWVEKDTYLLRAASADILLESDGLGLKIEMDMSYSGYDDPVTIEPPEELEFAFDIEEIPGFA